MLKEKKQGSFKPSLLILGIFFVFFFVLTAQNLAQAINQQITFQGKLTDASGNNLAGTYYLKFSIYDASTGGSCQYTGAGSCGSVTTTPVTLTSGIFSVNLGDTDNSLNALPATLFNADALYLGLTVCSGPNTGCDSEMTPRKRITASPYSFNSDRLSGLATSTSGGDASYIPATDSSGNLRISNSFYAATSTSGQLGFGTTTVPSGVKVFLDSTTASNKLLVLRANSSQTGNLTEWQNNAGTALMTINSSGNISASGTLQIFATSTLATSTISGYLGIGITAPQSALDVVGNINYTGLLKINNGTFLSTTTGSNSLAIGVSAGHSSSGSNNIFIGNSVGSANSGSGNTFLGFQAGVYNTTGNDNTFIGYDSGRYNETGYQNVFVGKYAGRANISGHDNTFLGISSGQLHTTGYNNTFIGELSGGNNISGQANVFLGYSAGFNETGSNKLYIANSNTASPLIYGEFDNQLIRINGDEQIIGSATLSDGTTSSTLSKNSFILAQDSSNDLGKFYVDSSGNLSASGTLGIFGNTTLQGSLSATSNTSSLRSLLLSSLTSAPNVAAGTLYFNSGDGKFYGYTSAGTAVDLGATGSGTNDWGRFASTFGAPALMTSSTYPVWFDGAVYASSTLNLGGNATAGLNNLTITSGRTDSENSLFDIKDYAGNSLLSFATSTDFFGGTFLSVGNNLSNNGAGVLILNGDASNNDGFLGFTDPASNSYLKAYLGGDEPGGIMLTMGDSNTTSSYSWNGIRLGGTYSGTDPLDTGKFYVDAATGNISSSGTLGIFGNTTLQGSLLVTSGNIGVGTSTPGAKLHLAGGTILQTVESAPSILSSITHANFSNPNSVAVSGHYAYVGDTGSHYLFVIDITNPNVPFVVGSFSNDCVEARIQVVGRYVYSGDTSNDSLCIIDVANPSAPVLVSQISDATYLPDPETIYVSGKYAYVTNPVGKRLTIVDISNPLNPVVKGSVTHTTQLSGAEGLYVVGKYAYISAFQYFTIVDVSDPTNPTIVGNENNGYLNNVSSVYVSGRYAYVVSNNGLDRFVVEDISNPASPSMAGSSSQINAGGLYVSGRYAYLTAGATVGTLKVMDITTPASPYVITSVSLSNPAGAIYVSGKYLYTLRPGATDYFSVVDLTGIDSPGGNIGNVSASDITVNDNMDVGNNLYVRSGLNVGAGGLLLNGDFGMSGGTTNTLSFSTSTVFTSAASNYSGNRAFTFDATNFSVFNSDRYIFSLRSNNSKVFSVSSNGDVRASGTLYALSNTVGTPGTPGDLSERVDIVEGENVESGDVVIMDTELTDTYRLSKTSYEKTVAGVVSTNPTIVVGNGKTEYTAAVAMIGRVPVKVVSENGPIKIGDYLVTASKPGFAMKYDISSGKTAAIIGVALEPLEGEEGKVLALVNSSLAPGFSSVGSTELNISSTNNNQLVMNADWDFNGFSIFNLKALRGKDNKWYIDEEGNLVAESVRSNKVQTKELIMEKDTADNYSTVGEGTIKSGENFVEIDNIAIKKDSKIFVTFRGNPGSFWWIADQSDGKFKIMLSSSASSDTIFDYWLMGVLDSSLSSPASVEEADQNNS
ncbi:MAG: hypothetical protein A2294_03990, partial [Candidatus Magasanikbacteria bacterium RIFOXYB2_FULL_38_10]